MAVVKPLLVGQLLIKDTGAAAGPPPTDNPILWDDLSDILWDDGQQILWDS